MNQRLNLVTNSFVMIRRWESLLVDFSLNQTIPIKSQINIAVISTEQLVIDTLNWIAEFKNRVIATETILAEKYLTVQDGEIADEDDIDGVITLDNEDVQQLIQQETNKVINKKYNPDFIGFSKETLLGCVFQNNEGNNRHIKQRELNKILDNSDLTQLEKT